MQFVRDDLPLTSLKANVLDYTALSILGLSWPQVDPSLNILLKNEMVKKFNFVLTIATLELLKCKNCFV